MELLQHDKLYDTVIFDTELYDEIKEKAMENEELRELIRTIIEEIGILSIGEVEGSVFDPENVDAAAIRQLQNTADTMNAMAVSAYERGYANSERNWKTGHKFPVAPPRLAWFVVVDDGPPMSYKLEQGSESDLVTYEKPQPWEVDAVPLPAIPDGYISIGRPINGMGRMYGFFDKGSNVPMGKKTIHRGIELWFKPGGASAPVWVPV